MKKIVGTLMLCLITTPTMALPPDWLSMRPEKRFASWTDQNPGCVVTAITFIDEYHGPPNHRLDDPDEVERAHVLCGNRNQRRFITLLKHGLGYNDPIAVIECSLRGRVCADY